MRHLKTVVYAFFFCLWALCATAATIQDMRLSAKQNNAVRFVADLSAKTDISVFRLTNPSRLVVDFKHTDFTEKARKRNFGKTGFISGIRLGHPDKDTARVVLDLPASELTESHFLLKPQGNIPWRFVLDLAPTGSSSSILESDQNLAGKSSGTFKKKQKIIVLDPGHGGQDPGAISKNGHYEKDLTLKMARETRELLQAAGYKVVLTRDKDIFISLRGRIQKAHAANADLFISIHADSAKNTSARGLSIYTISETASDKEAAALAERENKADILFGMDLGEYQPEVGNILIDFAKKYTMDQSALYASLVVKEMKKNVKLVPNPHRFAGFVVLKSPNIPSVLLEMGYLSNRTEERQLQKKSYRRELAQALVRAANNYFKTVEALE